MFNKLLDRFIKNTFFSSQLSQELDDHRESINQHEEELKELHALVEKLKENQEEHRLMLGNTHFFNTDLDLSYDEKRILMVLYASDFLLSAEDLAKKVSMDSYLITGYLEDLSLKGIPILKQKSLNNELFYTLDARFKALQAKQNLFKVNAVFNQRLLQEQAI
jgi:hypothetical protein